MQKYQWKCQRLTLNFIHLVFARVKYKKKQLDKGLMGLKYTLNVAAIIQTRPLTLTSETVCY